MNEKAKANLPATRTARVDDDTAAPPEYGLTLLDEASFERAMKLATLMSQAKGLPGFFGNSPGTCLAVIEDGLRLGISPFVVARNAYQATATAPLAYYGKFVAAVINRSPLLSGNLEYEHTGDWSRVDGKFVIKQSDKGTKYAMPTYQDRDEEGLGVIVRGTLRRTGEVKELELSIRQCHPRNSTLWATDPRQQICYVAARRWSDRHAPEILMGIGTDAESQEMIDITPAGEPRPARPKPKTLDDLVAAHNKPEPVAEAPTATKEEQETDEGAEMPEDAAAAPDEALAGEERPARSEYDQPNMPDEPELIPPPESVVPVITPGQRRPQSLGLPEASAHLLNLAGQVKNQRGAEWIQAAIKANPWTATHRPTAEGLRDHLERCSAGNGG